MRGEGFRRGKTQAKDGAEKGSGRLNACRTILRKPLIFHGGAGGFACVIPISRPFSALSRVCGINPVERSESSLAGLLRARLFFVVNRNRIQVFSLKDLVAIETPEVIDPVAAIEQFGSLVLTSLHNEVKLILECMKTVSSAKGERIGSQNPASTLPTRGGPFAHAWRPAGNGDSLANTP
jgi:hypothetical protein